MYRDKDRYYYEPISQTNTFKVIYDGEDSEIVGGWRKEYVIFKKRAFRLKTKKEVKNERQWRNIEKKYDGTLSAIPDIIPEPKTDPSKIIIEKGININFWKEEKRNILRVASDINEKQTGPLLLSENG